MSEIFSDIQIKAIIRDNKRLVEQRGQPFCVVKDKLEDIFSNVNLHNNMQNKKERIIRKAAHILGGITYQQPFCEGNRETALAHTILFLRDNGFDLPLDKQEDRQEVYDLLYQTVFKDELDPTIITEIEQYLTKRVT
ncbi:MAG: Fic family protein [Thaumarchaeota archaeon]|nr:Fic family protein [Nitrososphaerota archaeon]MDE1878812.1 Fic family protein [Nitrososphaerota archaeon]